MTKGAKEAGNRWTPKPVDALYGREWGLKEMVVDSSVTRKKANTHSVLSIVQPRSMKPNMSNINDANGAMGQLWGDRFRRQGQTQIQNSKKNALNILQKSSYTRD